LAAGNRVRNTGQLIDAETGTHLWADHFDGLIEDVFELQDKIATSVAGVIEPALRDAEIRRSAAVAHDRPHRLRPSSESDCHLPSIYERADFRGSGIA